MMSDKLKEALDLLSAPASKPVTGIIREHRSCCGTTCDREAVKRYIERLEVVADAAHHLEQSGVLADTPRMQNLKTALEELNNAG